LYSNTPRYSCFLVAGSYSRRDVVDVGDGVSMTPCYLTKCQILGIEMCRRRWVKIGWLFAVVPSFSPFVAVENNIYEEQIEMFSKKIPQELLMPLGLFFSNNS